MAFSVKNVAINRLKSESSANHAHKLASKENKCIATVTKLLERNETVKISEQAAINTHPASQASQPINQPTNPPNNQLNNSQPTNQPTAEQA